LGEVGIVDEVDPEIIGNMLEIRFTGASSIGRACEVELSCGLDVFVNGNPSLSG
jgi:hypothetical protein